MWMCHLVLLYVYYPSIMILMFHANSCIDQPSDYFLTSYDLYMFIYSFDTCYMDCICLSCLAQSNGATLGVTGDYDDATAPEILEAEESPNVVVEWTPDDVFQASLR